MDAQVVAIVAAVLIVGKWAAETWLEQLNRRHVQSHAGQVPEPFKETIDPPTYAKSVDYTLAKNRFGQVEGAWSTVILLAVLFSGILPWAYYSFIGHWGGSALALAGFLLLTAIVLSVPGLPFDWYAQFRLEERFGFNTTTQKLWWVDRCKGVLLSVVIGYPLLLLILKLVEWTGPWWWLWAWAAVFAFQLLMVVLAPSLIMPLFNKFTLLPEGGLRDRLLALGDRTDFPVRSIQVMDGSKRSRHSNAFFTGFRRFRKIVLFDTLTEQLKEPEIEAVVAHEIGHYKKRHIPKMIAGSGLLLLLGFYVLSVLASRTWFYEAFGFESVPGNIVPALLLFGFLSGVVTFWFSPLFHRWSRKFEYEADAFAADTVQSKDPLIGALRKLNEKNLSNLMPHPAYSGFYYSHPTLLEREQALNQLEI